MAVPGLEAFVRTSCFSTNKRPYPLVISNALQATEGKEQILGIGTPAAGFQKRVWDAALLMAKLKLLHIQVTRFLSCRLDLRHKRLAKPYESCAWALE